MAFKLKFLAAVCVATSTQWVVSAEVAVGVVDMNMALAEDSECSEGDEVCALVALQQKALRASNQAHDEGEMEEAANYNPACSGAVPTWLKARVRDASACLATCPQICGPLTVAMNGFVEFGEQPAFEKAVCDHVGAFACSYRAGKAACKGLGALMVSNGVNPPANYEVLKQTCRTKYQGGR